MAHFDTCESRHLSQHRPRVMGLLIARAFPVVAVFAAAALAIDDFLTYLQGGRKHNWRVS